MSKKKKPVDLTETSVPPQVNQPGKPTNPRMQKGEFGDLLSPILYLAVKPVLINLLNGVQSPPNKSALHHSFKTHVNSTVSLTTFSYWLDTLGISFKKVVQISGLHGAQTARPASSGDGASRPPTGQTLPDDEVRFDNESPMDAVNSVGTGDMFGALRAQELPPQITAIIGYLPPPGVTNL